jgi:hypothetical protein
MGELDGTARSLATATTALLKGVSDGILSGEEAQQVGIVIAAAARAYELETLEARVADLEAERDMPRLAAPVTIRYESEDNDLD